jgi:hypothetical protein
MHIMKRPYLILVVQRLNVGDNLCPGLDLTDNIPVILSAVQQDVLQKQLQDFGL